MPLIVEDGRCPALANSYINFEDADLYLVERGLWPETPVMETEKPDDGQENIEPDEGGIEGQNDEEQGDDEITGPVPDARIVKAKEAALIRAFDFLNTLKWKGRKPCWEKTPAWPRDNVPIPYSDPVEYIEPDCIPRLVVQAQCELAGLIYNGQGIFAPLEHGGKVKSVSDSSTETVDVLSESKSHSVTYADNAPVETWLPSVYPLIAPFLEEVPGEIKSGFTVHNVLRG